MICKSSTHKVFGEIFIEDDRIVVNHYTKPQLIIEDPKLIKGAKAKDPAIILSLFDDYHLCIGEIAALFDMKYHQVNKLLKTLPVKTNNNTGRRNSSYSTKFSEERRAKLRDAHKDDVPVGYIRTPEIKRKISETLKRKHASGEIVMDPKKYSDAWKRGCYDTAKMGRGIQGYFYSAKMNKDFYFRSLLELNYLTLIETDTRVQTYELEPFQIKLTESSHYTPDVLINNQWLIEFKPQDHLRYNDDIRFESEMNAAQEYCRAHNLNFKLCYDSDIKFDTRQYKRFLRDNPQIIKQFNIRFKDEARLKV